MSPKIEKEVESLGRQITTMMEILIMITLFAMFSTLAITMNVNSAIIDNTEDFVELVRYKGVITESMYYEFINGFQTPVSATIIVKKKPILAANSDIETIYWTNDVITAFGADENGDGKRDGLFKMNPGDEIEVIVRKPSGNYYDTVISSLTGGGSVYDPVIAVKGGMILNKQYGS